MKEAVNSDETDDVYDIPVSAVLSVQRQNAYGRVPGLDDEELADPDELERAVFIEMWGPVLGIPVRRRWSRVRPDIDEDGGVDWGAFGSIDFQRLVKFDKARYKIEKLREELRDVTIMISIIMERIPGRAKYLVLKYLRMGIVDLDHIVDADMRAAGRWYLKARRLRSEIAELAERRTRREQAQSRT